MHKYDYCTQIVYEKIKNLTQIKTPPIEVADLILEESRTELRLYDVAPDMQKVFIQCLAEQCWFDTYSEHYNK